MDVDEEGFSDPMDRDEDIEVEKTHGDSNDSHMSDRRSNEGDERESENDDNSGCEREECDDNDGSTHSSLVRALIPSEDEGSHRDDVNTGIVDTVDRNGRLSPSEVVAQQFEEYDTDCPKYLESGFKNVPLELKNLGFKNFNGLNPLDLYKDNYEFLQPAKKHEETMDSFSKAFSLVPFGDDSNYNQPTEGSPLYFISECNSMTFPDHVTDILYFFHSLLMFISQNGLTNHVLRSQTLSLGQSRTRDKVTTGVLENKMGSNSESFMDEGDFDREFRGASEILRDRNRQGVGDHLEEKDPFTIRMAYTGALFDVDGEIKHMLFCMVIVTPLINFDFLGYINYVFLNNPKNPQMKEMWRELCGIWKQIMMTEANDNCGLMGDPTLYKLDPGGELGIFSICNMLMVPYKVWNLVKKTYKDAENIRIMGCPSIRYSKDGMDDFYETYYHTLVNCVSKAYQQLTTDIQICLSMKDEERREKQWDMENVGGWPLKVANDNTGKVIFLRFGHFPWPIVMHFDIKKPENNLNKMGFMMNLGLIPLSVQHMLFVFKTFNPNVPNSVVISDEHILKSTEKATPIKILKTYYSSKVNIEDLSDKPLSKWCLAFCIHVSNARQNGGSSVEEITEQLRTHVKNCLMLHFEVMKSNGYGSEFFKQCIHVIENAHKTNLKTVSLKAYLEMCTKHRIHPSLRSNKFLRNYFFLMMHIADLNDDMKLNALNLEAMFDIMTSSVHWHVGSHNLTFTAFFQCVMIASGVGHLDVNVEKGSVQMFWEKPNSSGAGMIQQSIMRYYELLGKMFMFLATNNKMGLYSFFRTTKVGLENMVCVDFIDGKKVREPPPDQKYVDYAHTENRKAETPWAALIQYGFPRDSASDSQINTTADVNKDNLRQSITKYVKNFVHTCLFSTNEAAPPDDSPITLYVVMHAVDPGADAYKEPCEMEGGFNSSGVEL